MSNLKTITVSSTQYDLEDNATRTANRAIVTDSNGKMAVSAVTDVELAKLSGLTPSTTELNLLSGKGSNNLRTVTAGTEDLTAGTSELATDAIYLVYE